MDKGIKCFMFCTASLTIILLIISLIFGYGYIKSVDINYTYLVVMVLSFVLTCALFFFLLIVINAYKRRHIKKTYISFIRKGLNILLPVFSHIYKLFRVKDEALHLFYININNILIQSDEYKYAPDKVLLLLPRCMQNSDCTYKVTETISNCHRCGRCKISDISRICEETGIFVALAGGGTIARNLVKNTRPELIIAVACERELTSGILDVGNIPVVALINERPFGPCTNTSICVDDLKSVLDKILF